MVGSDNVIKIGSTGISEYPSDIYAVYGAAIKSFLEGINYDTFGEGDARAELRVLKFQNTSERMTQALQNTIKELLLVRFPEIENVSTEQVVNEGGLLMFKVRWKLLDSILTTEVQV